MNLTQLTRRFTIRTRMLGTVALVAIALLAVGGVGLAAQFYARSVNNAFVAKDFAAMTHIAQLRTNMSVLRSHEKDMIIQYENAVEVSKAKENWLTTLGQIEASAKALQGSLHNDAERAKVTQAMASLAKFKEGFLPVAKQLEAMGFDSARVAAAFMSRAQPDYDAAQSVIEGLAGDLNKAALAGSQKLDATAVMVMSMLAGSVALALILITPLTIINMRTICGPIRRAEELADAIAQGDLSERDVDVSGKDEAAHLLQALLTMQQSLRKIVSEVRQSTDSISTASMEIATGNHDLSVRTEQTASNLQQAASSMEQLTGTVKQSADSARQADQLAASAAEVAARGGKVVSEVVSTMDDINASSKKISDIIGVIDGIAFQTNILALNAAVEAARAGEQGRGFAVVAGEVRNLAQRSAEAAKEIKGLIGASVDKVESGSKLVADAGRTMQEIVSSVQRVTDIIGEITAASTEQSDGIGQINGSVAQLDQATQQNAALVEQSAAAAESLKDQTARLSQAVSVFRLHDAAHVH
ncbi:methyl-accepting chemotaxis protein [Piscinibacter terrae]|nr:methyl-accepting chemotaxis protein [Albitalea terrae]